VGDDDDARPQPFVEGHHQVEHGFGGAAVEVAGGFVGEYANGACDQGARNGGALTLAAGKGRRLG